MSDRSPRYLAPGPFVADQLREGDRYELTHGHAIYCAPAGPKHGAKHCFGVELFETDPDVAIAFNDVGFCPAPGTLRAPDVSVGAVPKHERGWMPGAPPLALEYAAEGQDEDDLQAKIAELLAAGTRHVWVARLVGLPRVEVYEPGVPMRLAGLDDELRAPGVLCNGVRVRALFEREVAHEHVLRNLLQRQGYRDLDAVRAEAETRGRAEGLREGLLDLAELLGVVLTAAQRTHLDALGAEELLALRHQLKQTRRWPV